MWNLKETYKYIQLLVEIIHLKFEIWILIILENMN